MEPMEIIRIVMAAKLVVNEGMSILKFYDDYVQKSNELSAGDKENLIKQIKETMAKVENSKFEII